MGRSKVTFLPYDISIEVPAGESVIRAAMSAGVHINASCGGDGVCGKCRVMIEQGQVEGGISEHLSAQDRDKSYRLACKSHINEDVVIRIPVESAIDTSALLRQSVEQYVPHPRQETGFHSASVHKQSCVAGQLISRSMGP